jgi:thymidylate kinase
MLDCVFKGFAEGDTMGLLVSFEGLDGSGKDEQLLALVRWVKDNDKYANIWVTREPTKIFEPGIEISERIRGSEMVEPHEAAVRYIEDRIMHSGIIQPMLRYSHVFSSRYDLSTLSYQRSNDVPFNDLYALHRYGKPNGTLIPHITVVCEVSPLVGLSRVGMRGSPEECFETIEFQEKVHDNLHYCITRLRELQPERNIVIIDGEQSIEDVTAEMIDKIGGYFI